MTNTNVTPSAPQTGNNKAYAAVVAGAVSAIVIYVIQQVIGHPLPAEIAAAVQTLVTTGAVWLTPHGSN